MKFQFLIIAALFSAPYCVNAQEPAAYDENIVFTVKELPVEGPTEEQVLQYQQFATKQDRIKRAAQATGDAARGYNTKTERINKTQQDADQIEAMVSEIVNTGVAVYKVFEKDNARLTETMQSSNAVPKMFRKDDKQPVIDESFWRLTGWSFPGMIKRYEVLIQSGGFFNKDIAKIVYQLTYDYGGAYEDKAGKRTGKYLKGVTVQVLRREVKSGYQADIKCVVPSASVRNAGTSANPVAAMDLILTINLKGTENSSNDGYSDSTIFSIRGDGSFDVTAKASAQQIAAVSRMR